MSAMTHIGKGIAMFKMLYRWSKSDDEEWARSWFWNKCMHEIRVDLELIEENCGGLKFYEFLAGGFFTNALKERIFINARLNPLPEDIDAIRDAWYEDDLYGKILSGAPGVLADVRIDAVDWFRGVVGITADKAFYYSFRLEDEQGSRCVSWKGYVDPNATWLEEQE